MFLSAITIMEVEIGICTFFHVPDRRPERDAMIAATALVHGLIIVTRNIADFARMGVPLLNPWLPAAQ
jgi:predicted nucleic acid-binding protein